MSLLCRLKGHEPVMRHWIEVKQCNLGEDHEFYAREVAFWCSRGCGYLGESFDELKEALDR